ncbi:aldo/keto reductase [Paludibaculum fermentans]|uniref:Aldo/keto reductase n=1 Tax=Paludibaculum fermentans TaxID=1473598 RepID=A0A7S7NW46_PALFE|nr:aldo/keto reductase [Paludibaculum fermentans]QOY90901.1 aldo/keto reductase [Paludibaculum fermentans]
MNRRVFAGVVFAGLAAPRAARAKAGDIPMRTLGRTGEKITIIGQGGARFGLIPLDEGKAVVRRAYELGINYFDMARAYTKGYGEEVYGAVIPEFRKEIFLTTKSLQRTRQGAEADLETSLRTMKTDHVDLWQLHMVSTMREVEQIFAPGGAIEAFEAAKKAGKCRYIGYTNCRDPQVHVEMLKHAERFDTCLMPLHVADTCFSESPKMSFEQTALPAAVERGVGIFAIKVFGNAFLLRTFSAGDCLRYTLSLPITATPLGACTLGQIEDDVRIAQKFKPLTAEEKQALVARAASGKFDAIRGPALEYWKTR